MSTVDGAGNNSTITAETQAKLNNASAKSFVRKYDKDGNSIFSKAEQRAVFSDQLHAKLAEVKSANEVGQIRINEAVDSADFTEANFKGVDDSKLVEIVKEILIEIRNFVAKIVDPLLNSKNYDIKEGTDEKGMKIIEQINYKNSDKRVADFRKPVVDEVDGFIPVDSQTKTSFVELYQLYPSDNK